MVKSTSGSRCFYNRYQLHYNMCYHAPDMLSNPIFKSLMAFAGCRYLQHSSLIHTLPSGRQPVWGMTVMNQEMFLVRGWSQDERKDSSLRVGCLLDMEVYDINTLALRRSFKVNGLEWPSDMTSCNKFHCLYITNCGIIYSVVRVDLAGETTKWPVCDFPEGISVTSPDDCNVIVTCPKTRKLKQFTSDGQIVGEIILQDDVINPIHAIKINEHYVVCHGWWSDPISRVCLVDSDGRVVHAYGGPRQHAEGLNFLRLVVDGEGNVLVADCSNERILLLSPRMNEIKELVSKDNDGRSPMPMRICLDESRGLLYVTDGGSRSTIDILVFKVLDI